jgi:hypothetical protein
VLTIELSVHQHVIDVNHILSRIQQILDDLFPTLALPNWSRIQDDWDSVTDQLDGRPLVGVLVGVFFRPNNLGMRL